MKILILCTGNSCRSQMVHGFLESFDNKLDVFSAGTKPAEKVNPMAVKVMDEMGIDLTRHTPKNVNLYIGKNGTMLLRSAVGQMKAARYLRVK